MVAISGFLIGLFGSLHCIGMCGPIVLALPVSSTLKGDQEADSGIAKSKKQFPSLRSIISRLLYNFGRVTTYSVMGLFIGFISDRIALFGIQQYFSIVFGLVLVLWI